MRTTTLILAGLLLAAPALAQSSGPDSLTPKGTEDLPPDTCMAVGMALGVRAEEDQKIVDALRAKGQLNAAEQAAVTRLEKRILEAREANQVMPSFYRDSMPSLELTKAALALPASQLIKLSQHCLP